MKYCSKQKPKPKASEIIQTPRVFHRERRLKRITLEKAYGFLPILAHCLISRDSYTSVKYVKLINLEEEYKELDEKEKKSPADKIELKRLEKEIAPLKTFLDDAAIHRKSIKAEIGKLFSLIVLILLHAYFVESLQEEITKCVIVVDFTKFTIVDDGSVSCFVVAVVSHDEDHVAGK